MGKARLDRIEICCKRAAKRGRETNWQIAGRGRRERGDARGRPGGEKGVGISGWVSWRLKKSKR